MRLLQWNDGGQIRLTPDLPDGQRPKYAILSHTWGAGDSEVTFDDLQQHRAQSKAGYVKIQFCIEQAKRDGFDYCWVDTCCINKGSHTELSEAITSMFRWYQEAEKCYVYLSDVSACASNEEGNLSDTWNESFRNSRWFTRGWTLQELLAPREVIFFSHEGQPLGTKEMLRELIHEITTLPSSALCNQRLASYSIEERMRWTKDRATSKPEDQAYCLLGIFGVYIPLIYGEGDYAFVRLMKEINQAPQVAVSLRVAEGAEFDAYGQIHQGCHPQTRLDLLQAVQDWAADEHGKNIFWLNGRAGTGKSTISWTIAKWLSDLGSGGNVSLGASFFFKRGERDRASALALFPTIARQLASRISQFDVFLAQAVQAHPQICSKALGEQFDKLISKPLQQVAHNSYASTYVVVLDALDECDREEDIRTILQLWSSLPATKNVRLRLFLTSRPELVIRLGFKKMSTAQYHGMILHDIPQPIIEHDISIFLADMLAHLRDEYNLEPMDEELEDDWPGSVVLDRLTTIAVPLFIVAATIYRFIRNFADPQEGLAAVLQSDKGGHLAGMADVYRTVLLAMSVPRARQSTEENVYRQFQVVVGSIVCLYEPLSRRALAALLNLLPSGVLLCLRPLHALIEVPTAEDAPIRPLHLSFCEYLTGLSAQGEVFAIDATKTHCMIWRDCLQLLSSSRGLREDICGLSEPGQLRSEIPSSLIQQYLPSEVQYACRYWVLHVKASKFEISDGDTIHTFLQRHVLHWLEALSLLDRLADAIGLLEILKLRLKSDSSDEIASFLEDARRFVLSNRQVVDLAPLQLYSSALCFAPQDSILRRQCHRASWILQSPLTAMTWGPALQVLEGHTDTVTAVAFLSDGDRLVAASRDGTLRFWRVNTGEELQKLEGHTDDVYKLAVSSDNSLLASASLDGTIRLWQVSTGQEVQRFKECSSSIKSMTFISDDTMLVSIDCDGIVKIWDVKSGQEIERYALGLYPLRTAAISADGSLLAFTVESAPNYSLRLWRVSKDSKMLRLEGHDDRISSVAFSPDNSVVASVSDDGTVRIWRTSSGQEVQVLHGFSSWRMTVSFSSDSLLIASASDYMEVIVWDVATGQRMRKLEGYNDRIWSIAFSPDLSLVASGSFDGTVRTWHMNEELNFPASSLHTDPIASVAFSPDGLTLASICSQKDLTLWRVDTGQKIQLLQGHTDTIYTPSFSIDGSLIASASINGTIRLWHRDSGAELRSFNLGDVKGSNVYGIVFSPDGFLLACATDSDIFVWQIESGLKIFQVQESVGYWGALAFSLDSSLLAVYSRSKSDHNIIRKWWIPTGEEVHVMARLEVCDAIVGTPNGSLFVSVVKTRQTDQWQISLARETVENITGLRYSLDYLRTYVHGEPPPELKWGASIAPSGQVIHSDYTILADDCWLKYRGKRLLWLPPEYRGLSFDYEESRVAIYDNVVAFGLKNGRVCFLRLGY